MPKYEQRARSRVKTFDRHPLEVRKAILSGVYRGDIPPNSNTAKALDAFNYRQAAKEFLDHKEYRKRKRQDPNDGVVQRMQRIAETFLQADQNGGNP
jgi:hypothetical protein